MISKSIGVIPTRISLSASEEDKNLNRREESLADFKNILQKKEDASQAIKKRSLNQDQSSWGIKKKVAKENKKNDPDKDEDNIRETKKRKEKEQNNLSSDMISKVMVSNENKFEILNETEGDELELTSENLAKIEELENNSNLNIEVDDSAGLQTQGQAEGEAISVNQEAFELKASDEEAIAGTASTSDLYSNASVKNTDLESRILNSLQNDQKDLLLNQKAEDISSNSGSVVDMVQTAAESATEASLQRESAGDHRHEGSHHEGNSEQQNFVAAFGNGDGSRPTSQATHNAGEVAFNTAMDQAKSASHEDNVIQDLISKAQFLAKAGGGEMTLNLNDESLGDVHLKVALQDGKVSIEMNTRDQNVKKMIEDSLSDLKSGLVSQHMSLDSVRINSVSNVNAENNMQFQTQQQFSGNSQNEFNWQNQQRSALMNSSNKASKAKLESFNVVPAPKLKYSSPGKGSGLNLVA